MKSVVITRTQSDNKGFRHLIAQLDNELNQRNQKAQSEYDKFKRIEALDTVVVAFENEEAVGCGCFKEYNDKTVELKRMFVSSAYRSKGISKLVLQELEKWARDLGYSKTILETGSKQFEAIGLYQKNGYTRIENYG